MNRRPDWRGALAQRSAALSGAPFQWGATDCAVLSLDLIDSMMGTAHAARARGFYGTAIEAIRWQRQVEDIADVLTEIGGVRIAAPPRVGDVLIGYRHPFWCAHVMVDPFHVQSSSVDLGVHQVATGLILAEPGVITCRF